MNSGQTRPLLSIVSPVYRAEAIVDELVARIQQEVSAISEDFEIVLVEDGSPDNSWRKIEENCAANPRVKGVKLSRNFGQHHAITAGLSEARGQFVVVLDCDLQDDPKYIRDLYDKAKDGEFDIVYTLKKKREHPFFKNLFASLFFAVFNWLADNQQAHANVGSYSLLSRKAVDAFLRFRDAHRHYLMVLRWIGFRHTYVEVLHEQRFEGRSSYSISKLINHAINGITGYSDRVLRLAVGIGFAFFVFSVLTAVYLIIRYFFDGFLAGWTSTIVLILLSTGIILMAIGVAGIYIGKIFEQVKDRPIFLIDKKLNC